MKIKAYITNEQSKKLENYSLDSDMIDEFTEKLWRSNFLFPLDMNRSIDLTEHNDEYLYMFKQSMTDMELVDEIEYIVGTVDIKFNKTKDVYKTKPILRIENDEKLPYHIKYEDIIDEISNYINKLYQKYDTYDHVVAYYDNYKNEICVHFMTEDDEEERIFKLS